MNSRTVAFVLDERCQPPIDDFLLALALGNLLGVGLGAVGKGGARQ